MRTGNYSAFYVAEPFDSGPLAAHQTKDFRYYNMLKMWKGAKEKRGQVHLNNREPDPFSLRGIVKDRKKDRRLSKRIQVNWAASLLQFRL